VGADQGRRHGRTGTKGKKGVRRQRDRVERDIKLKFDENEGREAELGRDGELDHSSLPSVSLFRPPNSLELHFADEQIAYLAEVFQRVSIEHKIVDGVEGEGLFDLGVGRQEDMSEGSEEEVRIQVERGWWEASSDVERS